MNSNNSALLGLTVFALYIAVVLLVASWRNKVRPDGTDYYLGGRSLAWLPLLLTTAATNFSAFTVLGLSGAGYRMGYSFYPAMAFGTGFMALGMYLVGVPLREEGARRSWITPVDLMTDRFHSPILTKLYAVCLVGFTLPYLALQPIAAGLLLESGWGIPYRVGALSVAGLIAIYTAMGGLRSLTKTDSFHGILLVLLAGIAWFAAIRTGGGFLAAHFTVSEASPSLLSRPGASGGLSPMALAGYYLLWFLADPIFPQLGQRFLASRDRRSMEKMVTLYPIITTVLFFLTISVGVVGAVVIPGLGAAQSDKIWLLMAIRSTGPVLSSILLLAPLAALVSTMDSQLLTLASIVSRELKLPDRYRRVLVLAIAAVGSLIAMFPPSDILSFLNRTSFLGYAALAPAVFGALYSSRTGAFAGIVSIIAGEAAVLLSGMKILGIKGVPDIILVAALSWGSWLAASRLKPGEKSAPIARIVELLPWKWALAFLSMPLLTLDFWNWGKPPVLLLGFPLWVLRSAILGLALSVLFAVFFTSRRRKSDRV